MAKHKINVDVDIQALRMVHEALSAKREAIGADLEDRDQVYDNHTEKWQESDNGQAYNEFTESLQSTYDKYDEQITALQDIIDAFDNEIINELQELDYYGKA
jgi:uncharacterized lipoprotein YmbA